MNRLLDADQRPQKFGGVFQWVEGILLVAGLVCAGWFGYNWIAMETDQLWSNYVLDAGLRGEDPTLSGFVAGMLSRDGRQPASDSAREMPRAAPPPPLVNPQLSEGDSVGRIEIPRLGIAALVRQGVEEKTLARAVGHVPYTALPGQPGNVGIAAHRDTHFRNLRDVKEGDTIRMVTPAGTFDYEVNSLRIVYPRDVEVLDPTPEPSMTLITCYPFNYVGHAPRRFIVSARQLGADASKTLTTSSPGSKKKRTARRRS